MGKYYRRDFNIIINGNYIVENINIIINDNSNNIMFCYFI